MSSEIDPAPVAYEHTDDYGHSLTMRPSFDLLNTACVRTSQAVFVKAEDLPGMVGALYRAAGQQSPIILPRLRWYGTDQTAHSCNGVRVTRDYKTITVFGHALTATTARGLATVLAEMAEAADAEPDPAQLAALAKVVRELAAKDVQTHDNNGEAVARAILAAGYARTEEQT